jgi:uncharacterized membrane protein YwzB
VDSFKINWSFGIAETIVEALFSIVLPIMLTRIAFAGSENERWLGTKGLIATSIVFLVPVAILFNVTIDRFTNIGTQLPLALFLTTVFIVIGFAISSPMEQMEGRGMRASAKMLAPVYFIGTAIVFFFAPIWLTPFTPHPLPAAPSTLVATTVLILMFWFLHRSSLSSGQLFAVVCGIATTMFVVSIFGPQRIFGAPIGVVLYVLVLAYTWWRMKREEKAVFI